MNTGIRHSLAVDLGAPRMPRDGEIWVDGEGKRRRYDMVSARWHLSADSSSSTDDPVSPSHYQGFRNGAEVIDITENLNFNRGNAIKYCARAGAKDPSKELEDLRKAKWYLEREISRLENQ